MSGFNGSDEAPFGRYMPWAKVVAAAMKEQLDFVRQDIANLTEQIDVELQDIRLQLRAHVEGRIPSRYGTELHARIETLERTMSAGRPNGDRPQALWAEPPRGGAASQLSDALLDSYLRRLQEGAAEVEDLADECGLETETLTEQLVTRRESVRNGQRRAHRR